MDRKAEIIHAALELASENGLGTVSMQQIADKIGITKASLYNHYSSRDQIVEAMYAFLRETSKQRAGIGTVDYDQLAEGRCFADILSCAVENYKKIITDPQMYMFYRVIMSERSINRIAAEIMVEETRTMINAAKMLFYALQVKRIADFQDVDTAAVSFAMAIHALLDYECDCEHSGRIKDTRLLQNYIDEFCRIYQVNGDEKHEE